MNRFGSQGLGARRSMLLAERSSQSRGEASSPLRPDLVDELGARTSDTGQDLVGDRGHLLRSRSMSSEPTAPALAEGRYGFEPACVCRGCLRARLLLAKRLIAEERTALAFGMLGDVVRDMAELRWRDGLTLIHREPVGFEDERLDAPSGV